MSRAAHRRWSAEPGRAVELPSWLLVPGLAIFVTSLAAFFLLARIVAPEPYDLSVYLLGGEAYRHGQPVYAQQMHSQWGTGYVTYPPVTLLLFGPMSHLSLTAAHLIMLAVGILSLLAVVWLTLRLTGCVPGKGLVGVALGLTGAAVWTQPVFDSLGQGQINIVLMLLVLADIALSGRRRWPTGVLIGLAAAAKLTPGIFVLYLLLTRRYRAALTAAATWAGLTAVGFAAAWADSVSFWLRGTFADSHRVASPLTVGSVFNQSIHGVAVRLFGDPAGDVAWYLLAPLVAAGGLAVAVAAHRLVSPLAGLLACALTGLLVSPLSWHEHWVWIVPVLIVLAGVGYRIHRRAPVIAGALPCLAGLAFLTWPQPSGVPGQVVPASILSPARHLWEDEGNRHPVVALAGAAYVAVGLLLLLAVGWALRRGRAAPARHRHTAAGATDPVTVPSGASAAGRPGLSG